MKETHAKYLAGLLDADGWFGVCKSRPTCKRMSLTQHCPRTLQWIKDKINLGWFTKTSWVVSSKRDLNLLMPHILKHMVIKAKLWNWVYTTERINPLEWKERRKNDVGPLRTKNFPTWAWTAGYLDGDGWITMNKRNDTKGYTIRVGVLCSYQDRVALDLLFKSFGGGFCEKKEGLQWQRGLGLGHTSFAERFLTKLVKHLVRKKHNAERILHYHHSQRLNIPTPTGEVIV